jgi:hypothetical protein
MTLENHNTLRQLRLAVLSILSSALFLDYCDFEASLSSGLDVKP